ncbi:MAG TPA: hypothetical protein VFA43_00900 [Gemmatimonadaceae bacterium]|nr:hypothetical protein [Gemmatimonadaceae bacterium]
MRRMGGLLAVALLAAVCATAPAGAQAVRLGVVMDGPRKQLVESWDEVNPKQLERAYCVVDWSYGVYHVSKTPPLQDDTVFRVFAIKNVDVTNATPISADFECPEGSPELHIHTPTTCMGDDVTTCKMGGLNAYSCQPSRDDYEKLVRRHDPFGVIQCDKRSFRFYYPAEYGPEGAVASKQPPDPLTQVAKQKAGNLTPAMKPGYERVPQPGGGGDQQP